MKYRQEIDGLRAIAVIPVILFHAGFEYFSGGFVGVDVFFVISGYLITTIILSEKEQGTFSILNFYDRRARRILPALFLVMLVSLPFAWFWLLPSDMKDFSESLIAVSTFSSNILFWQETGYWGVDNELKPLLHTWSLAVEEQYYLLFPLFLMLVWRCGKNGILVWFIFLAALSLALSQWGAYNHPTANFFLLPTRAWELAIGASIACFFLFKRQATQIILSHKLTNEVLGFIGLFMICYSVLVFNEATPFPSLYALYPTIGTGLIIFFSSKNTLVGKLLGSKILVAIGLISYSAYLWHQPLFAFARHRSLTEPSALLFISLSLLTFLLAYLSWQYIEKPFRIKGKLSGKTVATFAATGSALFIAIGIAGHITNGFNGFPLKNKLTQEAIEDKWKINYGLSNKCDELNTLSPECRTSEAPEILIWGDSYAMHLVDGILASNPNAKIIQMTKSYCGPFFNIAPVNQQYSRKWAESCLAFTYGVRTWLSNNDSIKYVVVSSPFSQYLSTDKEILLRNQSVEKSGVEFVTTEFMNTLNELIAMDVTPIVFSPPPANGINLGRCLAKAQWNGLPLGNCNFKLGNMSQARKDVYSFLDRISAKHHVIRLDQLICNDDTCKTNFGTTWIFRDKGHLSHEGSAELGIQQNFYKIITQNTHETQ